MAKGDAVEPGEKPSGGLPVGLVIGGILGAGLALFVVQNTNTTKVEFLTFEFRQPLWVVLLVTAAVTLVITELLGKARRRSRSKAAKGKRSRR